MPIEKTTLTVSEAVANWLIMKCDLNTCDSCDTFCLDEELKELEVDDEDVETLYYCSDECRDYMLTGLSLDVEWS